MQHNCFVVAVAGRIAAGSFLVGTRVYRREHPQKQTDILSGWLPPTTPARCPKNSSKFAETIAALAWGFQPAGSFAGDPTAVPPFFKNPTEISVQRARGFPSSSGLSVDPTPSSRISNYDQPSAWHTAGVYWRLAARNADRPCPARARTGGLRNRP